MRRLLSFAALCALPFAGPSVSAQVIRADPGEISPGKPIVPTEAPIAPPGLRMAPALKVRYALPPRRPDGSRNPDEVRLLGENEDITTYNIARLDDWLEELAAGGWTEADRAAAETALEDLRKEYTALAEIDRQRDGPRLPRLSFGRLQKPLRAERIGGGPEVRRENLKLARYNFLVTKANLIEAETMAASAQDVAAARKYHASAAKLLSDMEAREQEGRSGAAEGVRKAREALKGAGPSVPD